MFEQYKAPGKLEQILRAGGFNDVVESTATAMAWWDNAEEAACNISDMVKILVGDAWSENGIQRMPMEMQKVIENGGGGFVTDGQKVGVEVLVWTVLAIKRNTG